MHSNPRASDNGQSASSDEEYRWMQNLRANDLQWLSSRVEELERRLRRRTIALMGALVFGGLAVVIAVGFTDAPERSVATIKATLGQVRQAVAGRDFGQIGGTQATSTDLAAGRLSKAHQRQR